MVWTVLSLVYARPFYWVITSFVSVATLTVMVLLPNYAVLLSVLFSPVVSTVSKVAFFGSLYGSLATNFTILAAVSVVLIALLFGVNAALLVYYIRRMQSQTGRMAVAGTTTVGGFVAALLGIGCAACGSAVVAIMLQLVGVGWLVSYLPLHGAEFGLLGVLLLCVTTWTLIRKINQPAVCPI